MASTELISSVAKPKKKLSFGQKVGDVGLGILDTALNAAGLDVINQDMYASDKAGEVTNTLGQISGTLGGLAMTAFGGGMFSKPAGPKVFAEGGMLTKYEGNKHTEGGIPIGQGSEVEGGETAFALDNANDYIFSEQLMVPDTKQTFAQKSKRISSKYKDRPNDKYAKESQQRELIQLAGHQEAIKGMDKMNRIITGRKEAGILAMGGKRVKYVKGGPRNPLALTLPTEGVQPLEYDLTAGDFELNPISKMKSLPNTAALNPLKTPDLNDVPNFNYSAPEANSYQSNFLPTALGYVAQAGANIPVLTMKPETIKLPRVQLKDVSMAEERNEARRSRNLALSTAKATASGSGDMGQIMNYLAGTNAQTQGQYGSLINQSLTKEKLINNETNTKEQLTNAEIAEQEAQLQMVEDDSVRSAKLQAFNNLGTLAGSAGKDFLQMQQDDNMLNVLMGSNPDYTYEVDPKTGLFGQPKLRPIRRKANGGRRQK